MEQPQQQQQQQRAATTTATNINDGAVLTPSNFPSHITVKFVTKNELLKAPETPFKVPSDLTRFGLSEIVNHLINQDPPVPFEFLVEYKDNKKAFLRTSLKKFFLKVQKWPESILELEYTEAQPAPKCVDTVPHDDWVSAIDHCHLPVHLHASVSEIVFTGCYDGMVRVVDPSNGGVLSMAKHKNPVRAVVVASRAIGGAASLTDSEGEESKLDNDVLFCTASRDENVRIWKYDPRKQQCQLQIALAGHTDAVDCLALNKTHSMFVSGSLDKTLKMWELKAFTQTVTIPDADDDDGESSSSEPAKKKQRLIKQSLVGTLEGHYLGVTCVAWGAQGTIFSGSSDHTIRLWDVAKGATKTTLNGSKVPGSLSLNDNLGALISTHPDYLVRMWDPRMANPKASLFRSHKGWVRSAEWSPSNQYQFVSGGDDNLIKLWDIRSAVPLHSVSHHIAEDQKQKQQDDDDSVMVDDNEEPRASSGPAQPSVGHDNKVTRMARKQRVENHKVLAVKWAASQSQDATGDRPHALFTGSTDCTLKKHTFTSLRVE